MLSLHNNYYCYCYYYYCYYYCYYYYYYRIIFIFIFIFRVGAQTPWFLVALPCALSAVAGGMLHEE